MMLNKTQFKGLYEELNVGKSAPGGFSVELGTGKRPTSGFMVALGGTEGILSSAQGPRGIVNYARQSRESLFAPGVHLGGWKDEGKNTAAILDRSVRMPSSPDPVQRADRLTSAIDMATYHGQEAVYDVGRNETVQNPDWKLINRARHGR